MTTKQSPGGESGALEAFGGAEDMVTPTVHPLAIVVGRRGVRTVTIRCPYCSRLHSHGWPLDNEDVGHRLAHCGILRGYRIEATS